MPKPKRYARAEGAPLQNDRCSFPFRSVGGHRQDCLRAWQDNAVRVTVSALLVEMIEKNRTALEARKTVR